MGITIDNQLRWNTHINKITKKISKNVFLLSKLKIYIDVNCRRMFFFAHIKPYIDYISNAWDGASQNLLVTLNSIYRRAVKMILYETQISTNAKFAQLQILSLQQQLKFNKSVFMHKIINNVAPKYLTPRVIGSNNIKKESRMGTLHLPYARIDLFKNSLSFSGPKVWNTLPQNIKKIKNISPFKAALRKHLQTL